jgi:cytidyltransferase-like protein
MINHGKSDMPPPTGDNLKKIWVPGTWDLFHYGHANLLQRAAFYGEVIVGVNSDKWVIGTKGKAPVMNELERLFVVGACEGVKYAYVVPEPLDFRTLKSIVPDMIVLGSDWKGRDLKGLKEARQIAEILYFPYVDGISTDEIIKRIGRIT